MRGVREGWRFGVTYYRTPGMVNVRECRERRGMSIQDLADTSGLSMSTISVADNATGRGPSIKESTVKAIANALGVSKYELTVGPEELAVLEEIEGA